MVLSAHSGWRQGPAHGGTIKRRRAFCLQLEIMHRFKDCQHAAPLKEEMELMKKSDDCFSGFIIPRALPKARAKARIHKICNLALTFGRVQQVPICV